MEDAKPDPPDQVITSSAFTSESDAADSGNGDAEGAPSTFLQSRMGIPHLLLLTFYTAVGMGVFQLLYSVMNQGLSPTSPLLQFFASAVFGLAMTASTQAIRIACRTGDWKGLQAGHWLAMINSASWLAWGLVLLRSLLLRRPAPYTEMYAPISIGFIPAITCLRLISILIALRLCWDTRLWNSYFVYRVFVEVLVALALMIFLFTLRGDDGPSGATNFAIGMAWLAVFAEWVWVIVLLVVDLRGRTPRDWVHWSGIAVQLLGLVAALAIILSDIW